ncbi:toprim domain-containing protein [Dyadobacter sp. CY323]|uniref:toprim domain-containing protein n=1 Tax=Dyadobacter sp. CY323 TaxID=2907302 RepID=UPI001F33D48E|nr:toprim domain-containing protein [Dyadobacter sp. CY323]MCE6993186.1 toprim domain-containing protein [Dyadobacter sp. CY323]
MKVDKLKISTRPRFFFLISKAFFELCLFWKSMNVAQAKQIDLPSLLAQLGCQQQPVTRQGLWYLSPLRDEDTPSFKVWQLPSGLWCWKDFGSGEGGNVIAFANCMIGKETSDKAISDALKWLDRLNGVRVAQAPVKAITAPKSGQIKAIQSDRFTLIDNKRLTNPQLLGYLDERGIPAKLAQGFCGQANYLDNQSKKKFYGVSFPNIDGGLEIRAATAYKHHVNTGAKNISFIPGQKKEAQSLHLFEGFIDFLSYLVLTGQEKPQNPVIVLNSTAFAAQAANYIISNPALAETVKSVITYFDNDDAGQKAFDRMAELFEPTGHQLGDCSYIYQDQNCHDLNDYLKNVPTENRTAFIKSPVKFFDSSATAAHRRTQDYKPKI